MGTWSGNNFTILWKSLFLDSILKYFRTTLIVLFCTSRFIFSASALGLIATQPLPPVINFVSVDTATGEVVINWTSSPSTDVMDYVILVTRGENTSSPYTKIIDTIFNASLTTYITMYARPDSISEVIRLQAGDSSGIYSLNSNAQTTIKSTVNYDSCVYKAFISWTDSLGLKNISGYRVWYKINGNSYKILDSVGPLQRNYIFNSPSGNTHYCFFIESFRSDGIASNSNIQCFKTGTIINYTVILPDSVIATAASQTTLEYKIIGKTGTQRYYMLRSALENGSYDTIDHNLTVINNTISFSDNMNTANKYYYTVAGINFCGKPKFYCDTIPNMVLNISNPANESNLSWVPFPFRGNCNGYNIYRVINNNQQLITTTLDTSYSENIKQFMNGDSSSKVCYYLVAQETSDPFNVNMVVKSNLACISFTTVITMANTFTPDGNGLNDEIKPSFNFPPIDYSFTVYDRWGYKVFETTNINESWNGLYPNGKIADTGVYTYLIRIIGFDNKQQEKKGLITVLYPQNK